MGDGDEDGPRGGELSLFRLRSYTGFDRTMAADGHSGELLSITEAVFDDNDEYNAAFEQAIDMAVGDLLILDRVWLDKAYRGFGLGPVLAMEAVRRLSGGCCAVAVEPGMSEWPDGDPSSVSDAENDDATAKIAALWESIGFRPLKDGVYLLDTASDDSSIIKPAPQGTRRARPGVPGQPAAVVGRRVPVRGQFWRGKSARSRSRWLAPRPWTRRVSEMPRSVRS